MDLRQLAQIVKSDFKLLQESEIIGRIALVSGRNASRSIVGYKMMREQKFIPDDFVEKKTEGVLQGMIDKNPLILELLDRLDAIPTKSTVGPYPGWIPPKLADRESVKNSLGLTSFCD